jgi:plasmid maintenance system antidote protein VapI
MLKEIMAVHNLRPIELAKRLGISKSYCSMLLNNQRPISKKIALRLLEQFGVPLDVSLCPKVHGKETGRSSRSRGRKRLEK